MEVHLAVSAKYIIPVDEDASEFENHSIVIDKDGIIVDILPTQLLTQKYAPRNHVSLDNHILTPGLINAHTHATMSLFKGLADDKPLCNWLVEDIWPAEAKFVDEDFVRDGSELAIAEMIRSGTTTFNDMYFFAQETAKVAAKAGIRAVIGHTILDFPTKYAANPEEYLALARKVHLECIQHSSLLTSTIAPHAPYTVGDDTFVKVKDIAHEMNWPIHVHLHETKDECDHSEQQVEGSMNCHRSTEACRPIENLKRLGLLMKKLIAVHMTQLSDSEIQEVAINKVNVVHCPSSNLKLASGICRVQDLLERGVNVAIGTDGASSNNSINMFAEMKLAAIMAKAKAGRGNAVPAHQALKMATLNGATALGIGERTGNLQVGKFADMIAISVDSIEMMPMYSAISHVVYCASRENVSHVWVAGQPLMTNRKLMTLNEAKVKKSCMQWHDRICDYHAEMK